MVTLPVARHWSGEPLPPAQVAVVSLVHQREGLELFFDAPLWGDPSPPGPPGPTDQLWEYEVLELFLAGPGGPGEVPYVEFEVGPAGHYLALLLRGVRRVERQRMATEVEVRRGGGRFSGRALLPTAWLPPTPWRVNATALRGTGAQRVFASHAPLPGDRPDFHQPERFVPWPLTAP
jgi:hypothetical protein